jgi:hypothetical protein
MQRKSLWMMAAALGITLSSLSTLSAGSTVVSADPQVPVVIQGTITNVADNWLTVVTKSWSPSCPPGTMCPQYVIAGSTFRVNVAHAVEETYSGTSVKPGVYTGELVIVVGYEKPNSGGKDSKNSKGTSAKGGNNAPNQPQLVVANVIEQVVGTGSPAGLAATASSIRINR